MQIELSDKQATLVKEMSLDHLQNYYSGEMTDTNRHVFLLTAPESSFDLDGPDVVDLKGIVNRLLTESEKVALQEFLDSRGNRK